VTTTRLATSTDLPSWLVIVAIALAAASFIMLIVEMRRRERGGAAIALTRGMNEFQPGRETGIALETSDARAAHDELKGKGIDVDGELMGGDGTVPLLFGFRDSDGNGLMVVEERQ